MAESKIDTLPRELLDRVFALRTRGWGPDRIHRELRRDLDPYGVGPKTLANWLYSRTGSNPRPGENATERLGRIADLLEKSGIKPDEIGKVKTVRLSEWQGLTKDAEGEAHVHELQGAAIALTPTWDEGPKWPVVQPSKPFRVPRPPKPREHSDGWRRAVILPDVQIGFRRDLDTGELTAFHDEKAMEAALRVTRVVDPDVVVFLGDVVDLAPASRFEQEPGFALTMQPAIDRAALFLAEAAAAAPHAHLVFIQGNHDIRLQKLITANAGAAFGLRPGFTPPDTWPDLSIPHLLRFDELDIEYKDGYPAGIYWLNQNVACLHGHKVTSAGSTAARVVDDARVSVIFGHVHRIELMHRTRQVYEGARSSFAATPGCLCKIDGAVPSTKSSMDVFGRGVPAVENWQNGCAVVTYEEGDGRFALELVPIHGGDVLFRGRQLEAA